jgi:hypothetical protein
LTGAGPAKTEYDLFRIPSCRKLPPPGRANSRGLFIPDCR